MPKDVEFKGFKHPKCPVSKTVAKKLVDYKGSISNSMCMWIFSWLENYTKCNSAFSSFAGPDAYNSICCFLGENNEIFDKLRKDFNSNFHIEKT